MFGVLEQNEFKLWQEVWPQAGSILGVDLTFSQKQETIHSFIEIARPYLGKKFLQCGLVADREPKAEVRRPPGPCCGVSR